jgi:hypothetical protein
MQISQNTLTQPIHKRKPRPAANQPTESTRTDTPSDAVEITGKDVLKAGVSTLKALPKALLNHTVGCTCAVFGVLGGAVYAGTLVGPLVNSSAPAPDPSIEETVFQAQMPVPGMMLMGTGDMLERGASKASSFAKEMMAPITWGVDAYKAGYKLLD